MAQEETQPQQTADTVEKTFTQAEVDEIVKKRLSRVKAEPADYAELKEKAAKLDELENANKTELQKATEQLEKLKAEVAKRDRMAELDKLKAQVSKDTGVPAELIAGNTEDEMSEWAKKIAEFAKRDTAPTNTHAGTFAKATKDEGKSYYAKIAEQFRKD